MAFGSSGIGVAFLYWAVMLEMAIVDVLDMFWATLDRYPLDFFAYYVNRDRQRTFIRLEAIIAIKLTLLPISTISNEDGCGCQWYPRCKTRERCTRYQPVAEVESSEIREEAPRLAWEVKMES